MGGHSARLTGWRQRRPPVTRQYAFKRLLSEDNAATRERPGATFELGTSRTIPSTICLGTESENAVSVFRAVSTCCRVDTGDTSVCCTETVIRPEFLSSIK